MIDKYLILIAGSPATGKTYLINQIKNVINNVLVLTPDDCKEIFADSVGFNNLSEKMELEKRVWKLYYGVLELYMEAGKRVILSEYPFSSKQTKQLSYLSHKYTYEVITIRLTADFNILWERRKTRDIEKERHLSHIMSHYHFGDQLDNRTKADNLITKKEFRKVIEDRGYNNFQLGKLFEFDVSNFEQVNYEQFLTELADRIN